MDDISLAQFKSMEKAKDIAAYISALEAFDSTTQIQELKRAERARHPLGPGTEVLDVGCGFGLQSLRMAQTLGGAGRVTGLDASPAFLAEAQRRAAKERADVTYVQGDAQALPFPDDHFDQTRAERVLIYLSQPKRAVEEMIRVTRPGGGIAFIEPAFWSNAINHPNPMLARKVLNHEARTAVTQAHLPPLLAMWLKGFGLADIQVDTRVVIFPQDLAQNYFGALGDKAHMAGEIDEDDAREWTQGLDGLSQTGELFGTIEYFLFTARISP